MVIFDCDGVLVDSEIIAFRCFVDLLKHSGYHIETQEALSRFLGRSDKDAMEEISKESGIQFSDEFLPNMRQVIHDSMHDQVKATPGVAELLQYLQRRNIARCVASSSHMDRIHDSLKTANIFSYFLKEHIFSAQQVKRRKPAPDLFLLAAEQVGYDPKDCLVIEDSIYGVEGAHAAGMIAIGYVGGSHAHYPWFRERLEAYKIPVVDNFNAVLQYLN